jgi:hypothetical protein
MERGYKNNLQKCEKEIISWNQESAQLVFQPPGSCPLRKGKKTDLLHFLLIQHQHFMKLPSLLYIHRLCTLLMLYAEDCQIATLFPKKIGTRLNEILCLQQSAFGKTR